MCDASFGAEFLGLVDDNNWMRGGNPSGDMGLFKQATAGVAGLVEVAAVGIERFGRGSASDAQSDGRSYRWSCR
jgi:hypothetical protein